MSKSGKNEKKQTTSPLQLGSGEYHFLGPLHYHVKNVFDFQDTETLLLCYMQGCNFHEMKKAGK